MSFEKTVDALLETAASAVQSALRDATVEAIFDDASPALRELVRRAYELGYREALAGHALSPPPARTAAAEPSADELEPEALHDEPVSNGGDAEQANPPDDDDPLDDDDGLGAGASTPSTPALSWDAADDIATPRVSRSTADRPFKPAIMPHATIGRLRSRIIRHFGLERFDVDVVICRKGDRNRRQLKQTVKLSKYLVEAR